VTAADTAINLEHELVKLAGRIDWDRVRTLQRRGSAGDRDPLRDPIVAAQHIYGLSDEGVCERRVYDHYFQCFPDEEFFQHQFPHERSDLSHWRYCWPRACAWRTKPAPSVTRDLKPRSYEPLPRLGSSRAPSDHDDQVTALY
jgi:hypothetical protein